MSKKRRQFTSEFKLQCVLDLISGRKRPVDICREHNLSDSLLNVIKLSGKTENREVKFGCQSNGQRRKKWTQ